MVEQLLGMSLEAQWYLRRWVPQLVRDLSRGERRLPRHPQTPAAWLRQAHEIPGVPKDMQGKRVLVFAYLTYWMDYMSAVSSALIARGAHVTIAWLPWQYFERDTPFHEQARMRFRYGRMLAGRGPQLRSIDLSLFPESPVPASACDELQQLARVDTQYVTHVEEIDVEGAHRAFYTLRLRQLEQVYGAMTRAVAEVPHDVVIIPNGGCLNFSAAFAAARDAGANVVTMESWERRNTCVICRGRSFKDDMGVDVWARDSKVLDEARRRRVAESMAKREGTRWEGYVLSALQRGEAQDPHRLRERLALDERPVVLVCPNIPFDAAYLQLEGTFDSMSAWLRAVLRHFAHRSDCQVVIRAHPAEADPSVLSATGKGAGAVVREELPTLPAHMRFVAPEAKVNTYSLMGLAKLGLVFGSTTGLEMAMRGLPVVMPIRTHYCGKGFTIDASTSEEYFAAIDREVGAPAHRLPQELIDLAWCYCDVYMHGWPRPIPWNNPSLDADMREWPLERVVGPEGLEKYGATFRALLGEDA